METVLSAVSAGLAVCAEQSATAARAVTPPAAFSQPFGEQFTTSAPIHPGSTVHTHRGHVKPLTTCSARLLAAGAAAAAGPELLRCEERLHRAGTAAAAAAAAAAGAPTRRTQASCFCLCCCMHTLAQQTRA